MRTINAFATFLFVLFASVNTAYSVPLQPIQQVRHGEWQRPGLNEFLHYALSHDAQKLVTCQFEAKLWDIQSGALMREFAIPGTSTDELGHITCVAFSPDNQHVFTGRVVYSGTMWNIQTGEPLYRIRTAFLTSGESTQTPLGVTGIAFRPQNKSFLTADFQGFIQEWDIESGEEIQRYRTLPGVQGISLLADGNYLYIQRLTTGVILDLRTGAIIKEYEAYRYSVSPNASYLALLTSPEISIVDARTFEVVSMYPHPEWIESMAVSNDGKTLLLGAWADSEEHKRERLIIDLNTRSIAAEYPVQVSDDRNSYLSTDDGVALFPDHRRFLTRNLSTIHVWDISNLVTDVPAAQMHED